MEEERGGEKEKPERDPEREDPHLHPAVDFIISDCMCVRVRVLEISRVVATASAFFGSLAASNVDFRNRTNFEV
jgi:hypothetical protein